MALLSPTLVDAQPAVTRASLGPAGVEGNLPSSKASVSGNGRWVAFMSTASNLVVGDTNGTPDIFVRDRWTGTTTRVSVGPGGVEASGSALGSDEPAISADGRWVAFQSWSTNLVVGDTNDLLDVFVHDLQTGTTSRVSVGPGGVQANAGCADPSISADGRFIAFESSANNLVAGETGTIADIFVHDRQTGTNSRVSVGPAGVQGNSTSLDASISADGQVVTFSSFASNLVPGGGNNAKHIFVHDRQTGSTTRASVGPGGVLGIANSDAPAISADGHWVTFISQANNLVAGDTNGRVDAFVRDLQMGVTTRISVGLGGAEADWSSNAVSISGDGRFVAFQSSATNLVVGKTTNRADIFVRDQKAGTTTRLNLGPMRVEGNDSSFAPLISANGRWVSFESDASNLVPGDANGRTDVFLIDRRVPGDVDFDGRADPAVYRPSSGVWYVLESWAQYSTWFARTWGVSTDVPVPGDYDGDGRTDLAVYRPSTGTWYILESNAQFTTWFGRSWGVSSDVPVPGDYDGDGRTDLAIYRPSTGTWYVLESSTQYATWSGTTWGLSTDVPVAGDYDGDGRTDLAVYRPSTGTWYVLESGAHYTTWFGRSWGVSTDVPVPGDYDGDGRTDLAIYRPSTGAWYILESNAQYTTAQTRSWGLSTDIPVAADFDGDRRTDVAIYRPATGVWYVLQSGTGFTGWLSHVWGIVDDWPVTEGARR